MSADYYVAVERVEDGFVYIITKPDGSTMSSRLWPTVAKAQQAGQDFAHFLATGEVIATPVIDA